MNTIEKILRLIEQSGQNNYVIEKAAELSNASINTWKVGKAKPSAEAITKLARYFGVTTDYLLGLSDTAAAVTEEKQEYQVLYEALSLENKAFVLNNMKGLIEEQGEDVLKILAAVKKAIKI